MGLTVERVDVWAASIKDQPGGLAWVRRSPEEPGTGVVFVTPLRGDAEVAAAADLGFNVTNSLHSVRVEGDNRPGIGSEITQKLADAGINLRGLSAGVIGSRFILYIGLDTADDSDRAMEVIEGM